MWLKLFAIGELGKLKIFYHNILQFTFHGFLNQSNLILFTASDFSFHDSQFTTFSHISHRRSYQ